jgi:putative transcriptional regulator
MPLSDKALEKRDAGRNIGEELLQSLRQMKKDRKEKVHSPVAQARYKVGLSQAQFAALLGVSVRTLQDWEQGRRQPSGAAQTLLKIAETRPEVLRELAA